MLRKMLIVLSVALMLSSLQCQTVQALDFRLVYIEEWMINVADEYIPYVRSYFLGDPLQTAYFNNTWMLFKIGDWERMLWLPTVLKAWYQKGGLHELWEMEYYTNKVSNGTLTYINNFNWSYMDYWGYDLSEYYGIDYTESNKLVVYLTERFNLKLWVSKNAPLFPTAPYDALIQGGITPRCIDFRTSSDPYRPDWKVDMAEVSAMSLHYGREQGKTLWEYYDEYVLDLNVDGKINIKDCAIVSKYYGWVA